MYPICAIVYWVVDLGEDRGTGFISEIINASDSLFSLSSVPFLSCNESLLLIY